MCSLSPKFEQAAWGSPHSRLDPSWVNVNQRVFSDQKFNSMKLFIWTCVSSVVDGAEKAIWKRQLASAERPGGCSRGHSPDSVHVQVESCRCKEFSIKPPKQYLIYLIAKTEFKFPACTGECSRNPDANKAGSKSVSLHWHNCEVLEEIHVSSWVVGGGQENGKDWWNCRYSYCECRAGGTDKRSEQTQLVFLACQLTHSDCCQIIAAWQNAAIPTLHGSLFLHEAPQEFGVCRSRVGSKCEGNPAAQVCRTRTKLVLLEHEYLEPVCRWKFKRKLII